jgi:REP element-mobilizing transposase RayT
MKFDVGEVVVRKRNRLPHWDVQHGILFVTFNLFDAVPQHVRARIREEADAQRSMILKMRGNLTIGEKLTIARWVEAEISNALDGSHGRCFMRDERIAAIVAETITHFDESRYRLLAWCVMPNHVHVVFTPHERLDKVMHSWKSYTAKQANAALGRTGAFWQDDYYDRVVRDSRELAETVEYVMANPVKAGLRDWPFVGAYPERVPPGGAPGGGRAGRPLH